MCELLGENSVDGDVPRKLPYRLDLGMERKGSGNGDGSDFERIQFHCEWNQCQRRGMRRLRLCPTDPDPDFGELY